MHSVWGAGQMAWTKSVFVVDQSVSPHDTFAVLRAAAQHCHPLRDVELVHGPLDILDHAAPFVGAGTKFGFDCTPKRAGESVHGIPTDAASPLAPATFTPMNDQEAALYEHAVGSIAGVTGARLPSELGRGWLLITIKKATPGHGIDTLKALYQHDTLSPTGLAASQLPPFVIILSDGVNLLDLDAALFHWLAHFDAGRDALRWQSGDRRTHRLGMDATTKSPADTRLGVPARQWPPVLTMDPAIVQRVSDRWHELGLP
jgi:4-hydroxy-3-polyprenylbenzoate decarboxylase